MGPKFSIRYKFLIVTTALLVMCVVAYLSLATFVFKSDKTELIFDYNKSLVVNLASEVESYFEGLGDKMRLIAYFYQDKNIKDARVAQEIIERTPDLVYLAGSDRFEKIDRQLYVNSEFQKIYSIEESFFENEILKKRPIPFERIQIEGDAIWNATVSDGPALIGFARTVVEEDHRGVPVNQFALIAFVKADRFLKSIQEGQFNETYIMNSFGEIIVHSDHQLLNRTQNVDSKLFASAKKDTLRTRVLKFEQEGEIYLGAYSKALSDKVIVGSSVTEKNAFAALNRLIFRSVLFASIVVTLAFIVAIIFSRSLTRPIENLVRGMERVSGGDLNTKISVKTRDEIAMLAGSFNQMISDLKQSRHELEEINRELENKVKERTRQLEERNLAVKEAQEALLRTTRLAAAGEVAGLAAHEVLNPLTSIIARISDVKRRLVDERSQELVLLKDIKEAWKKDYSEGGFKKLILGWEKPSSVQPGQTLWDEDIGNIEIISKNLEKEYNELIDDANFLLSESQRIGRIINSFRKLNSVQADIREHSASKLLNQSIKIMVDLASKNNIAINLYSESNNDLVLVDEDEFIQVVTNLIRNSIQAIQMASNVSQGRIDITTKGEGSKLTVRIKDNGVGISDSNKKLVFEKPFTTKSRSEGTGIGLSISRRLMRAFKGDIRLVSSEEGRGTEFELSLPLSQAEQRSSA